MTVVMTEPDHRAVVNLMQHVLDSIVSVYDQAGVTLPGRRYWTMGTPAADDEQLTVSLAQLIVGPPGDSGAVPQRCEGPRSATVQVQILRCIPTTGVRNATPSAAAIQAASEAMAVDAWLLLDSATAIDAWGLGVIATVSAGEAQGGFQGPMLTLTLAVP